MIYKKDLPFEEREKQAATIEIPKRLKVRSLGIVDPGVEDDSWKDFTKWEIAHEVRFS